MKKSQLHEGEEYKLVVAPFSNLPNDGWEKEHKCPKCGNNKWRVFYRTGNKNLSADSVKLKCTECGMFFLTKVELLSKVLGA